MKIFFPILSFLLGSQIGAQEPKPVPTRLAPEISAAVDFHPNIVYARYGDRAMQLDLYRPKVADGPLPAIVCIHGGAWFKGERGHMANLAQALSAKGFVAVTISYRLSGEAKFPAAIQDCKAAVRWLRANAVKYGIQRNAIGVTGLSAGGHLAALLATSGGVKELEGDGGNAEYSSGVQACVAMGAQSDFESDRIRALSQAPENPHYRPFLGKAFNEIPQTYALASPRHHLDPSDPPLAFMTGELDDASTHADEMRRDLMALGIPGGLIEISKAPHAFLNQQKPFDIGVAACEAFFTLHLTHEGSPPVKCDVPGVFANDAKWHLIGSGYTGCEGAQWVGETLYFAAHHDLFAFKWSEKTGLKVWRDDSPEATSFRPDGNGGFYVVEQSYRRLTRWNSSGQMIEVLADKLDGMQLNRPNDCIVRSDDSLWITDPDYLFNIRVEDTKELPGQFVFRFDPKNNQLTIVARDFDKPNGIAFSPDEKHLFVTDSGTSNLYRFSVNANNGLDDRQIVATFKEKGLDGLAIDPAGRLWCCTRDGIRVLSLEGKTLGLIQTPGKPTSIAFGNHDRLCVTTRDACFISFIQPNHP